MEYLTSHFPAIDLLSSLVLPLVELTASQITSLDAYFSAVCAMVLSFSWCRTTYGHSSLNHSSTTILPLRSARLTVLPFWSWSEKSGAAWPISAPLAPSPANVADTHN